MLANTGIALVLPSIHRPPPRVTAQGPVVAGTPVVADGMQAFAEERQCRRIDRRWALSVGGQRGASSPAVSGLGTRTEAAPHSLGSQPGPPSLETASQRAGRENTRAHIIAGQALVDTSGFQKESLGVVVNSDGQLRRLTLRQDTVCSAERPAATQR